MTSRHLAIVPEDVGTSPESQRQKMGKRRVVIAVAIGTLMLFIGATVLALRVLAQPLAFAVIGHHVVAVRPVSAARVAVGETLVASPPLPDHAHLLEQTVAAIQRMTIHGRTYTIVETMSLHHHLFPWRAVLPSTAYRVVWTIPRPIASVYVAIHAHASLLDGVFVAALLGVILLAVSTAHSIRSVIRSPR